MCRILCWLFPSTLTTLRRIAMLLTFSRQFDALPQLFFSCHLHQKGRRMPKEAKHKICPDNSRFNLVFFRTFKELMLPIKGPMEDAGVVKLYEPSQTQCLYVAHAQNMVCRTPLMPCSLDGNMTLTIPHKYSKNTNLCFPEGC